MYFRYRIIIVIVLLLLRTVTGYVQAQPKGLYFLSDCQLPLFSEKIFLKPYKNQEGRDSIFALLKAEKPSCLFILGDIVGKGSSKRNWKSVDTLLEGLRVTGVKVYAIPGNHEYKGNRLKALENFKRRFPGQSIYGYKIITDSVAVILLNSNFSKMDGEHTQHQMNWYLAVMDSLDNDPSVNSILVCTHHAPYSNSKIVGSSEEVRQAFMARFEASPKTRLFISGHSHNLEYFEGKDRKHFLVCGGGGGLAQPLFKEDKTKYTDLLRGQEIPLFFFVQLIPVGQSIEVKARGFTRNFSRESLVLPL